MLQPLQTGAAVSARASKSHAVRARKELIVYVIVETSGRQFRVKQGDVITVDRMQAEVGSEVTLDRVLMVHGDEVKIGSPCVDGAAVTAKVLDHTRGEKVITFKYRPTRRMRRRVGFRHSHTQLEIVGIQA